MPLFSLNNINNQLHVGVWKLEESAEKLLALIDLSEKEKLYFSRIKNTSRQRQWLSCRALLKEMHPSGIEIVYTQSGKPLTNKPSLNISISHTTKFSAVILSKDHGVGIDLERISERLKRVSPKMASEKERRMAASDNKKELEHLTTIWCAKETIFKLCETQMLNFSEDIFVDINSLNKEGFFNVFLNQGKTTVFRLKKEVIEDHVLVHTTVALLEK